MSWGICKEMNFSLVFNWNFYDCMSCSITVRPTFHIKHLHLSSQMIHFPPSSSSQPQINYILLYILPIIITMRKGQQIKHKKQPTTLRSPAHNDNPNTHLQTTSPAYVITIKAEKPRKGSDKLPNDNAKGHQRGKKIKFITEEIEKSAHDLLSARSKSNHRQRSAKLSPPNIEDENAYELCRSKRSHRGAEKSRENGEDNHQQKREVNIGNIKTRKSQSKDKVRLHLKLEGGGKRNTSKKGKGALSSRKNEKIQQERRFLSPELVKLENSYYFSNYDEEEDEAKPVYPNPNQPVTSIQPSQPQQASTLSVPKKESKFIFESNQDFWNDPHNKRLLTSTLDLLN